MTSIVKILFKSDENAPTLGFARVSAPTYVDLVKVIFARYPNRGYKITYEDDEADQCLVSSESELQEARALFSLKALKLLVEIEPRKNLSTTSMAKVETDDERKTPTAGLRQKESEQDEIKDGKVLPLVQISSAEIPDQPPVLKLSMESKRQVNQNWSDLMCDIFKEQHEMSDKISFLEREFFQQIVELQNRRKQGIIKMFNEVLDGMTSESAVNALVWCFKSYTRSWQLLPIESFEVVPVFGKHNILPSKEYKVGLGSKDPSVYTSLGTDFTAWCWVPLLQNSPSLTRFLIEQMARASMCEAVFDGI